MGEEKANEQDLLMKIIWPELIKIKLPNTKIKLLQQLLAKTIEAIKKINKVKGHWFYKKNGNHIKNDTTIRIPMIFFRSEVYEEMAEALTNMIWEVKKGV